MADQSTTPSDDFEGGFFGGDPDPSTNPTTYAEALESLHHLAAMVRSVWIGQPSWDVDGDYRELALSAWDIAQAMGRTGRLSAPRSERMSPHQARKYITRVLDRFYDPGGLEYWRWVEGQHRRLGERSVIEFHLQNLVSRWGRRSDQELTKWTLGFIRKLKREFGGYHRVREKPYAMPTNYRPVARHCHELTSIDPERDPPSLPSEALVTYRTLRTYLDELLGFLRHAVVEVLVVDEAAATVTLKGKTYDLASNPRAKLFLVLGETEEPIRGPDLAKHCRCTDAYQLVRGVRDKYPKLGGYIESSRGGYTLRGVRVVRADNAGES